MSASWAGGSTRTWRRLRLYVLDRDGFRCQLPAKGGSSSNGGELCGAYATHVDHVVPLSKGGAKYDDRNCRAACASCNLSRGNRDTAPAAARQRRPLAWSW